MGDDFDQVLERLVFFRLWPLIEGPTTAPGIMVLTELGPYSYSIAVDPDIDNSGRIDGYDLVQLALAFGAQRGQARYNGRADLNGSGIVNGNDLAILAMYFGETL